MSIVILSLHSVLSLPLSKKTLFSQVPNPCLSWMLAIFRIFYSADGGGGWEQKENLYLQANITDYTSYVVMISLLVISLKIINL